MKTYQEKVTDLIAAVDNLSGLLDSDLAAVKPYEGEIAALNEAVRELNRTPAPVLTPLQALEMLYTSFQHDDSGKSKGNQAKTDIIKHNEDVRAALNQARRTLWEAGK